DTGLTPLTQYCYKVRAFRVTGGNTKYSSVSNTSCATTPGPPSAPSNADARPASSTEIQVAWSDNSGTEDGFRVERSAATAGPWETAATTGPNATSYRDGGRASEQQVCYRVIALSANGDSAPSNADCTAPPAGPTGLTATTAAQGIDLAWVDNSAVEDGYEVQRATDGVTFSTLAHVPANSTTYHDATATSSTTYWYRVRAKKDGGFSDLSNVASAQGSCVPSGPAEICGNGVEDDDCDGVGEGFDPDCPLDCGAQECPSGYVCDPVTAFCVPHCNDGAWNGDEGDTDCGGSCETKCQAGQKCTINFDCASGQCVGGTCQP
ncbi:MAG: fibronectin type III domain-containing protein, partial [Gemmatimonadaceae bacterium]